jgi:hypothetical protein
VITPLATTHAPNIAGLARGTRYYHRIAATDATGNTALSAADTFTTLPNHAPIVAAGVTPASGIVPLTGVFNSTGTSDPEGDSLTYAWTFGDGGIGNGPTPNHVYAVAGVYAAALTVTDAFGGRASKSVAVTVNAPAFPATAVLDNFNRANGALGSQWIGTLSNLSIKTNVVAQTASGSPAPIWKGTIFGADQEAYITLVAITSNAPEHDLLLKCQGTSTSAGAIQIRYDARVKKIYVATCTPGSGWTTRGTITQTLAAGDQLGARAYANGNVEVYRKGAKLATVSVSAWTYAKNGGRIGFALSNATATRLDNFGGGSLAQTAQLMAMAPQDAVGPTLEPAAPPMLEAPQRIELSQGFPNPSTSDVSFALMLPRASRVRLDIFDTQGRLVWSEAREMQAGQHTLSTRGGGTAFAAKPGIYLARVDVERLRFVRRFVVVK